MIFVKQVSLPMTWRENEFGDPDLALFIGNARVGAIMFWKNRQQWRAWFMYDDEGDEVGWYATVDEARQALEIRASSTV